MTAPDLSDYERAVVERIEAAEPAEESFDAVAALRRVLGLHNDTKLRGICVECSDEITVGWPCATVAAIRGDQ